LGVLRGRSDRGSMGTPVWFSIHMEVGDRGGEED
jgi:hypothetical protein